MKTPSLDQRMIDMIEKSSSVQTSMMEMMKSLGESSKQLNDTSMLHAKHLDENNKVVVELLKRDAEKWALIKWLLAILIVAIIVLAGAEKALKFIQPL